MIIVILMGCRPSYRAFNDLEILSLSPPVKIDSFLIELSNNGIIFLQIPETQQNGSLKLVNVSNGDQKFLANEEFQGFDYPSFGPSGEKIIGISEGSINYWDISDLTSSVQNPLNLDN